LERWWSRWRARWERWQGGVRHMVAVEEGRKAWIFAVSEQKYTWNEGSEG